MVADLVWDAVLIDSVWDVASIDLDAYRILRCTPKLFDFEVLLDPLEEQFHAPFVLVELRNQFCRCLQIVRQEMYLKPSSGSSMMSF